MHEAWRLIRRQCGRGQGPGKLLACPRPPPRAPFPASVGSRRRSACGASTGQHEQHPRPRWDAVRAMAPCPPTPTAWICVDFDCVALVQSGACPRRLDNRRRASPAMGGARWAPYHSWWNPWHGCSIAAGLAGGSVVVQRNAAGSGPLVATRRRLRLREIAEVAEHRWPTWFGCPAPALQLMFLDESPSHTGRALCFVFAGDEGQPSVVGKWALNRSEQQFVAHEQQALQVLPGLLDADMASSLPRGLGLTPLGEGVMSWMTALSGRRVDNPLLRAPSWRVARTLRRYLRDVLGWSTRLAAATSRPTGKPADARAVVSRFLETYAADESEVITGCAFGEQVSGMVPPARCWQHGDVSPRNTLRERGRIRLVDWEHAADDALPWHDSAVVLRNLVFLVAGRRTSTAVLHGLRYLGADALVAGAIRAEVRRSWTHALPLADGIVLAWMDQALRRRDAGRLGDEVLAELPRLLLFDDTTRREVGWLAPKASAR